MFFVVVVFVVNPWLIFMALFGSMLVREIEQDKIVSTIEVI